MASSRYAALWLRSVPRSSSVDFNAAAHVAADDLREALLQLRASWEAVMTPAARGHTNPTGTRRRFSPRRGSDATHRLPPWPRRPPRSRARNARMKIERATDVAEFDAVLAEAYEFPARVMVFCFPRLLEPLGGRSHVTRTATQLPCLQPRKRATVSAPPWWEHGEQRADGGFASELMSWAVADSVECGCTTTSLQATENGAGAPSTPGSDTKTSAPMGAPVRRPRGSRMRQRTTSEGHPQRGSGDG